MNCNGEHCYCSTTHIRGKEHYICCNCGHKKEIKNYDIYSSIYPPIGTAVTTRHPQPQVDSWTISYAPV